MRSTELHARAVVAATVLALLVGCGGGGPGPRAGESGGNAFVFQIAAATNALEPGQSLQLQTVVQDTDLRDLNVRLAYSSSNPDVAMVSSNGLVTALQVGTTEIAVEIPGDAASPRAFRRVFVQHPVRNKIAFVSIRGPNVGSPAAFPAGGIYLMNPDGSNQQLTVPSEVVKCSTNPGNPDRCPRHWSRPSWHPDGMRLATTAFRVYDADRIGPHLFLCSSAQPQCDVLDPYPPILPPPPHPGGTRLPLIAQTPAWAPQGDRLAFDSGLWIPAEHRFAEFSGLELSWSPEALRVVYVVREQDTELRIDSELRIKRVDTSAENGITDNAVNDENPAWSPDGSQIAFATNRDGNYEIYLFRANDGALTRLTHDAGDDRFPTWSPDGTRIAFQSNRDGNDEIYSMNADGSDPVNLTNNPAPDSEPAWSRN